MALRSRPMGFHNVHIRVPDPARLERGTGRKWEETGGEGKAHSDYWQAMVVASSSDNRSPSGRKRIDHVGFRFAALADEAD